MLRRIDIQNFAIIDQLALELPAGMSALTGETGAGKSILVDVVGLLCGDRADSHMVREGAADARLAASFDLPDPHPARQWLDDAGLGDPDHAGYVIVRRQLVRTGKSRAWINGQPATIRQLRELGGQLVDVHGQHAHQLLLDRKQQRTILDALGEAALPDAVRATWDQIHDLRRALEAAETRGLQNADRLELLKFQLDELDRFNPERADLEAVQSEQRTLGHAEDIRLALTSARDLVDGDEQAETLLTRALQQLQHAQQHAPAIAAIAERLDEILQQLQDLMPEMRALHDAIEADPQRLEATEQRLEGYLSLARKHRCQPEDLEALHQTLRSDLDAIVHHDENLETLRAELREAESRYHRDAARLGEQRRTSATRIAATITAAMQELGMQGGRFEVELHHDPKRIHVHGHESPEFRVATNPGSSALPLDQVASGGELSRIGLALQLLQSARQRPATLIFDEVDAGISGRVADIVGRKLRALGETAQVLCVTHLPQVAACAHHQFEVRKMRETDRTRTQVDPVEGDERIEALAALLGGRTIGTTARDTARALLEAAHET